MRLITVLVAVVAFTAQSANAQHPIKVVATTHDGDLVGPRFVFDVRERISRSPRFTSTGDDREHWELHIVTVDDDQHTWTSYSAVLTSRVLKCGSWTPIFFQHWSGFVGSRV